MRDPLDTSEADILRSWRVNAKPWTAAVRSQAIPSRKLVTDRAVVDAVRSVEPKRVFDIGCGEGWLARALQDGGIEVVGIDSVPELVEEARRLGGGTFECRAYEDIANGSERYGEEARRLGGGGVERGAYENIANWQNGEESQRRPTRAGAVQRVRNLPASTPDLDILDLGTFDAAVCNFSLLGQESVNALVGAIGTYLNTPGYLIVQTLHPVAACGDQPYRDGWRPGSWTGFGADFSDPAPWFFRTLSSWYAMLRRAGFDVVECREPTAPGAASPSSIIFIARQSTRRRHESL